MIRANSLARFLSQKTGINRDDFLVTTSNPKAISITEPITGGPQQIKKEYNAEITIVDVNKKRQFTAISLYIKDWFSTYGYEKETNRIETEDYGDEQECNVVVFVEFMEITNLIALTTEQIQAYDNADFSSIKFEDVIIYNDVRYTESEIAQRKGI